MAGAGAREHEITPALVQRAAASLGLEPVSHRRKISLPAFPVSLPTSLPKWAKIAGLALLALAAILAAVLYFKPIETWVEAPPPTPPGRPPMRTKLAAIPRPVPTPQDLVLPAAATRPVPRPAVRETPDDFVSPVAPVASDAPR
jgi:hypothetical protein